MDWGSGELYFLDSPKETLQQKIAYMAFNDGPEDQAFGKEDRGHFCRLKLNRLVLVRKDAPHRTCPVLPATGDHVRRTTSRLFLDL